MRFPAALAVCVTASACGFQLSPAGSMGTSDDTVEIDAAIDAPACLATWYDLAAPKRQKLTINAAKVTGTPFGVQVLVDTVVTTALPSGNDILFTAGDGLARLPYEIERYEPGSGRLIAWVRVPMLSSTANTPIYMYYGNTNAGNQQDPPGVWAPDYTAVWHMNESPSGTAPQVKDRTGAGRHATVRGGLQGGVVQGKITDSLAFDGSNDGLDVASMPIAATFSYEAWIYPTTLSMWRAVVNNSPTHNRWFGVYNEDLDFYTGTDYQRPSALTINAWHHVAVTYDGVALKLYRDGMQEGAVQTVSLGAVSSGTFQIGYTDNSLNEWFIGRIDEVRVSKVARSPGFLATSFTNQNAPDMFFLPPEPAESCP